jgi:hypothetical protein
MGVSKKLTVREVAIRKARFREAVHLQIIEGNPLDAEDLAMFEMFHRKRWSDERCRAYILARAKELAGSTSKRP